MKDERKTKSQLVEELSELRERIKSLESAKGKRSFKDKLRESEERYRHIFENSPFGIGISDLDGNVLECNKAMEEITGYTLKELRRINLADTYVNAEDRAFIYRALRQDGAVTDFPVKLKRKGGAHYDALLSIALMRTGDKEVVHTVAQDITERKRTEQALRESEERYRTLVEQAQEPISVIQDSKHVYVNPAYCRLLGYAGPDELLGRPLEEIIAPPDREMVRERYEKRMAGEEAPSNYELRLLQKDGGVIWVEVAVHMTPFEGRPAVEAASHDITRRKLADQALRESEMRYRDLFEHSALPMSRASLSGKIIAVNARFAELTGYSRNELLYKMTIADLVPPELAGSVMATHWARRATGAPESYETVIVTKEGERRTVAITTRLIPGTDEDIAVLQNITERKQAEQEMETSRQQMRALSARVLSAQEKERTRISREIHDELAQALTALRFDLTSLRKRFAGREDALAQKLTEMDDRISETISAVRRISTELRPGMLDDLGLVSAAEWYLNDFQERTKIKCDLKIQPKDFALDAERSTAVFRILQEALTNVIRHAKATEVLVSLIKEPDQLLFVVRDNGRGITVEQASSRKSLGLIGMRERARLWQGSVRIEGVMGKGTTVAVEIPLGESPGGGKAR